ALAAEPQHGFDEVPLGALGSSKQAAGPHDEMPAADRSHEMLASELADSVGRAGGGCILFAVRSLPVVMRTPFANRSGKDEVGADVDQPRTRWFAPEGEVSRTKCVHRKGDVRLVLGPIDEVVGRGVDH